MTKTIEDLLIYAATGIEIFIILFFFSFYKKAGTQKSLWIIIIYCFASLFINYTSRIFFRDNLHIFYAFFTLIEYCLFALFFYINIQKTSFKNLIKIVSPLFIIFIIVYSITTDLKSIDSIPIGVETILILIFSFYFLYEQMNNAENLFIYTKYTFWIVSGIMLYLAGSFFIYIFAGQVDRETLLRYWFLTNVFYILKSLLFIVAIFIHLKEKKSPRPKNLYPYLN